jgi:hypothetical protein
MGEITKRIEKPPKIDTAENYSEVRQNKFLHFRRWEEEKN